MSLFMIKLVVRKHGILQINGFQLLSSPITNANNVCAQHLKNQSTFGKY